VAEDSFLPRWLSKRGHRLVFSNGIIVLTVLALALLIGVGANTNNLVPFYAIGVFTGFSMAGFGMARYHIRHKEPAWRRRLVINIAGGVYTALVVVIFAIVKFTEGAWLVLAVFPIMVFAFIRLNRQYKAEATAVETLAAGHLPDPPNYPRRTVLVFIDDFDLAAIAALRYARSLHPTMLRAVHIVLDQDRAGHLREQWLRTGQGIPLSLVDCPDRRIDRAAGELAAAETTAPDTYLTVVLPRRSSPPWLGRLLHDRTADKIARTISRIPHSAATIIPYDISAKTTALHQRLPGLQVAASPPEAAADGHHKANGPCPTTASSPERRCQVSVAGRVHSLEIRPVNQSSILACTIIHPTGQTTALFYGRSYIPGLALGRNVQLHGTASLSKDGTIMINPAYELLA
jgi:hypothetical protein